MNIKKLCTGALAVFMILTALIFPAEIRASAVGTLTEGLVLHVSFDDATANDSSGNEHNGTITGEILFVEGVSGSAAELKDQGNAGTSSEGTKYISFGKSKNIVPATGNFAVSLWLKSTATSNNGTILGNKDYDKGINAGFVIGSYSTDLNVNLADGSAIGQLKGVDTPELMTAVDGQWHHLLANYDRAGKLSCYLDGVFANEVDISAVTGDINGDRDLVLGADSLLRYGTDNYIFDELRIYNRVITSDEARVLYEKDCPKELSDPVEKLKKMLTVLDGIAPDAVYPEAAIEGVKMRIAEACELIQGGTLTEEATNAMIAEIQEAYQAVLDGAKPEASFHMIADVHIGGNDANTGNYVKALKDMKTINADTAIAMVNAGDFTKNSVQQEYIDFYDATEQNNPVTAEQTLILLGNHDVRGVFSDGWHTDPTNPGIYTNWPTYKGYYQEHNRNFMPEYAQETLYHAKELSGYTFIMLNTELGLKDALYMSPEQLLWFEETMKTAYEKDPTKPIFIISHQALNDTHWRGNTLDGFDGINQPYQTGADAKVKEIMKKYPAGVFLSGHIHNGLGVARVMPREYGVTIDVPSFIEADSNNGGRQVGVGYEVQIYDGLLYLRARNYVTGKWLPEFNVKVPIGSQHGYAAIAKKAHEVLDNPDQYDNIDNVAAAATPFFALLDCRYEQDGINYWDPAPANLLYGAETHKELMGLAEGLSAAISKLNPPSPPPSPNPDNGAGHRGTKPKDKDNVLRNADGTVAVITKQKNSIMVEVTMPKGVTNTVVTIPDSTATRGTVAVIRYPDGTRRLIHNTMVKDGMVSFPLTASAQIEIVDQTKTFADVQENYWSADAITFVTSHELFNGVSETAFAPDQAMTRSMFVTVLHRMANEPAAEQVTAFDDVQADSWYTDAASWAFAHHIVSGDGTFFHPADSITREQLAVMLYQYAGAPKGAAALAAFEDADALSPWASEAMAWSVEKGLMSGTDSGKLLPQNNVSRVQVATIIMRFMMLQETGELA